MQVFAEVATAPPRRRVCQAEMAIYPLGLPLPKQDLLASVFAEVATAHVGVDGSAERS